MNKMGKVLISAIAVCALAVAGATPAQAAGRTIGGLSCSSPFVVYSHSTTTGTTTHTHYSTWGTEQRTWANGVNLLFRNTTFGFPSVSSVYIYKTTAGTPTGGRACG